MKKVVVREMTDRSKSSRVFRIVVCVLIVFCIIVGMVKTVSKLRTKAFEFPQNDDSIFSQWVFCQEFCISPPTNALKVKAIAYPGSSIFNLNCLVDSNDFFRLSKDLKSSPIYFSLPDLAEPFYRGGEWRRIRSGYYIELNNEVLPPTVNVEIWYEPESRQLLYRQTGRCTGR